MRHHELTHSYSAIITIDHAQFADLRHLIENCPEILLLDIEDGHPDQQRPPSVAR